MAETKIADVIIPEVFTPYMLEGSLNQNRFFQSGIMQVVPQLGQFLAGGGKTFNIPYWKDLTGVTDVPAEDSDDTVNNISSDKMIGIRQIRVKDWGANDLAAAFAGSDPAGAIAERVVGFWAKAMEDLLIYTIRGVIADNVANDSSDLVYDISVADAANATADNKISSSATIQSVLKQGDRFADIVGVAVHSAVYATLLDNDLIDFRPDSEGKLVIPYYMGLRLVVSDNIYCVAAGSGYKYHSYFFKAGAVGFDSYGGPIKEVELYRNPYRGGGMDVLFTRRQFCIQPLGFSWKKASNTAVSPSDADLYAGTSWDRLYELKNTGVVALISNG